MPQLLEYAETLTATSSEGQTVLMMAVLTGNTAVCKMLLSSDLDCGINLQDKEV